MNSLVKIIVPLYKGHLTDEEQRSLHQTMKVLARYPVVFVAPEEVDVTSVTDLFSGHEVLRVFFPQAKVQAMPEVLSRRLWTASESPTLRQYM